MKLTREIFQDIEKTVTNLHPTEELNPELLKDIKLYKGEGCAKCGGSGYKGRLGIYEILRVKEAVADAIIADKSARELNIIARQEGMCTLKQDGIIKALEGMTTIEEVYRVANAV